MKQEFKRANIGIAEIVGITLAVSAFVILLFFQNLLFAQESKETYSTACKLQLTAASQGEVIGFDECQNYMIIFKEEIAEKYILKKDKVEIFEKYDYNTILKKLKNKELIGKTITIKDNKIPEEIIFFILSEEIKSCFSVYAANNFKTFTMFENENSHMCHSCSLIMFDDNFQFFNNVPASIEKLNSFFNNVPADREELTYSDYIKSNYNHVFEPQYQKEAKISKNNLYNLLITYDKVPKNSIRDTKREGYYVKTSHVALINQDFFSDICSCTLRLAPKTINTGLDSYENLLNEAILFMV